MPTTTTPVQSFLILRQERQYSFVWHTATGAYWHSVTLTTGQEQELVRVLEQAAQEALHPYKEQPG